MSTEAAGPTDSAGRLQALDILRGFALFGILVMNIQAFAMIPDAYTHPVVTGPLEGTEFAVWLGAELFFNNKFIAIFTLLFGAGIVLMTGRAEAGGDDGRRLHRRRMAGLAVIGLAHAYLVWFGDILFVYAVCGLIAVMARDWPVRRLMRWAVGLFAVPMLTGALITAAMLLLAPDDLERLRAEVWAPPQAAIDAEIAAYRGSWIEQMAARVPESFGMHSFVLPTEGIWGTLGLMLAGMAAFRSGMLTGAWSDAAYARVALWGFALGLVLAGVGAWLNIRAGWQMEYSLYLGRMFNHWAGPVMGAGWIGLMILAARRLPRLAEAIFTPVGRTALSNYLLQSLICTWVFYGHGLGLFAALDRVEQLWVVLGVWLVMPVWSRLWLARFRFGPAEWLWRSMSYGRMQPLRKAAAS